MLLPRPSLAAAGVAAAPPSAARQGEAQLQWSLPWTPAANWFNLQAHIAAPTCRRAAQGGRRQLWHLGHLGQGHGPSFGREPVAPLPPPPLLLSAATAAIAVAMGCSSAACRVMSAVAAAPPTCMPRFLQRRPP